MSDTAVIPLGLEGFARPPSITFLSHLYGAVSTSSDPSAQNLSCSVYMTGSQCPMRRFMDADLKEERVHALFVWVLALEGSKGGGGGDKGKPAPSLPAPFLHSCQGPLSRTKHMYSGQNLVSCCS
eukprot:1157922-Pelagomonas_calceolata.AAC.25